MAQQSIESKTDYEYPIRAFFYKYPKYFEQIIGHAFKTSALCKGGGVKDLPNLPTVGGRGQKS